MIKKKHNLFITNKNYILLFSTFKFALKEFSRFAVDGGVNMHQDTLEGIEIAARSIKMHNAKLTGQIYYSIPNEPIFLLKKKIHKIKMFQNPLYENVEFWNVIVGEKIGWIIAENNINIKQLEKI